jgi:hypothetical protein
MASIRSERVIAALPAKVWEIVSDPARVTEWFPLPDEAAPLLQPLLTQALEAIDILVAGHASK